MVTAIYRHGPATSQPCAPSSSCWHRKSCRQKALPDVSLYRTPQSASRRQRRQAATQRAPAQQVYSSISPTRGRHTCSGVSGQPAAPLCGFFLPGSDTRSCRWAAPRCTCPWDNSRPGGFLVLQPGAALPPCSERYDASLNRRKNPEGT